MEDLLEFDISLLSDSAWLLLKLLLIVILFAIPVLSQSRYEIIDLGTLGGYSSAKSVNDSGQVVGVSAINDTIDKAFLWEKGKMIDLGTIENYDETVAEAINDSLQIVGTLSDYDFADNPKTPKPFLYKNGKMTDLGSLGGTYKPEEGLGAYDINNSGQIVGGSPNADSLERAFLWEAGNMIDLGTLGGNESSAHGINNWGEIVGGAENSGGIVRAFLWKYNLSNGGKMQDLGALDGGSSYAYAINDFDQVVGISITSNGTMVACLWDNGNIIDLGVLNGRAWGINDSGTVVGQGYISGNQPLTAFIWKDGKVTNLNTLIDHDSGWNLYGAWSINNEGEIVGVGSHNGNSRAFLLEPGLSITEPVKNEKWIAGETDTIKWEGGIDNQLIQIDYSIDSGKTFHIWDSGMQGSTGKYAWDIPDTTLSKKFMIRIFDMNDTTNVDTSDVFKIKGYILTRDSSGQYEPYRKKTDQWWYYNIQNDMWPPDWYSRFNYQGTDPFTGKQYSQLQGDSVFAKSKSYDFPDWESWVNTFSVKACYINTEAGIYSPTAITKWASIKNKWGGSCFGIAAANALAFSYRDQFQTKYPYYPNFNEPIEVSSDTSVKKVVNELYTHVYGKAWDVNNEAKINITPNQTLNEIKQMLLMDDSQPKTLTLYDNRTGNTGAHTILPYRLRQDPVVRNLYYIFVYDNSKPASNSPITIDTTGNGNKGTWSTPDWYGWGGNKNIYLEIPAYNYLNTEVLPKVNEYKSVFILSDSTLEINYPGRSTVKIIDTKGNTTGFDNGWMLNEIPGSIVKRTINGSGTPPYGYTLPTDNYSVILDNFSEDTVKTFFFTGNKTFSYKRTGATNTQTDRLYFDGGVSVTNPDQQTKSVSLSNIVNETTREKLFAIRSVELQENDSVKIENPDSNKLKFISYGSAKDYDIELNLASKSGLGRFVDYNIPLTANTSHTMVPDWTDISNNKLKILVDVGNDGTTDDTLYLDNVVDVKEEGNNRVPTEYRLEQNYPNPFNPTTTIKYDLPTRSFVTLKVYNILGEEVATLVNGVKQAGSYNVVFSASSLPSGVYIYTLATDEFVSSKKMMILK